LSQNEDMVEVLSIDNEAVRKSQMDRINDTKRDRDEDKAQAALDALKKSGALEEVRTGEG
jgi:methylmalonyl-CoA mutase